MGMQYRLLIKGGLGQDAIMPPFAFHKVTFSADVLARIVGLTRGTTETLCSEVNIYNIYLYGKRYFFFRTNCF